MQKLSVSEIFYSLQGEGLRTGTANIFIRLAGCNLKCEFCDTNTENFQSLFVSEILKELFKYPCKNIIWCGGEPTLQLNNEITRYFFNHGYYQAIETNGTNRIPDFINWITVSPKAQIHSTIQRIDELKLLVTDLSPIVFNPMHYIGISNIYLSPVFKSNKVSQEILKHCIKFIKENPRWRLTWQNHKLWKIK